MRLSRLRLSPRRRRPALRAFLTALVCWINLALNLGTGLAGDILRGAGNGPQSRGAAAAEGNAPAAAVQAGVSGTDTLSRTTMALQAVTNMQAAARAAVHGANNAGADPNHPGQMLPNVPNGLAVGGLQVAPGVPANLANPMPGENPALWQGANLPTQTASSGQTHVTITQTAQQAILNWQTFNIGSATRLTFDQTAGGANASQWIAFNKVNDPSGVPSQILGSLDAIGQVYVINANGIIFGGNSQINLHALVASALPINDNLIARGLLNNPDDQFLFSALPIPAGSNGTPAFTPAPSNIPGGNYGDVTVQAGAQITSPSSADNVGGRVALIGANVTNDGTITTPDGQTILAAGLQVGMAAHASTDPSLRGVDVYVGQVGTYAGTATNNGLIEAPRADVTMAGKEVDQLGFIDSSTSVSLNGRIDLLANYDAVGSGGIAGLPPFLPQSAGTVIFGDTSATQIVPEYNSTERIVGTQLALGSQINVQGQTENLHGSAIVFAPSALVNFNAGTWDYFTAGGFPNDLFIYSAGQINLDAGALIDVSGSQNVTASVAENIVKAQLLGPELANSPSQRNGPLRGQTVYIDITQTGTYNGQTWIGSPIADLSGYANLVQRTVGELTTNGGTVNLNAGGSVAVQAGATVNVSGGSINYQGANVQTTQVISASGQIFDISQATPDRVYAGIANGFADIHTKWGIVNSFQNPFQVGGNFETGYVHGGNGGALNISAPTMILSGALVGNTVTGSRQRAAPPTASQLSLTFQTQDPQSLNFFEPSPPNIVFESDPTLAPVGALVLSTDIVDSGFGIVKIDNSDGNLTLPAGVSLNVGVNGSLTIAAANIDIEGDIQSAGGSLSFTTYDISPHVSLAETPPVDPTRGHFTLGSAAVLNTAGLFVNDTPQSPTADTLPLVVKGGSVTINSFDTQLETGSLVDVSGGALVSGAGQISYGNGGTISVSGGQDANILSLLGGHLTLDATLQGCSGATGGTLNLRAPLVQVGGSGTNNDVLLLDPEFFSKGGFTTFSLSGIGEADTAHPGQFLPGVLIAPQTTIGPVAQTLLATADSNGQLSLTPTLEPQGLRKPVNLSFAAIGANDSFLGGVVIVRGDLVLSDGSQIQTDPGAQVSLTGNTATILGSVIAPGGSITVKGASNSFNFFAAGVPVPTAVIGPNAMLSAAGVTVLTPNAFGFRTGSVLDGGTISISGNIVAEAGSRFDVSGTTDTLDLAPGYSGQPASNNPSSPPLVPTRVDSNGGTISLNGTQELFVDSTLTGSAGGPTANGGNLIVSTAGSSFGGVVQVPTTVTIQVSQNGPTITNPDSVGVGTPVLDTSGQPVTPLGYFAADSFNGRGFDSLTINGTVQFAGPVTLNANSSIRVGTTGVVYADSAVTLNAPYVDLGMAFLPPVPTSQQTSPFTGGGGAFYVPPVNGSGSLNVNAQLIDVGNLSLQNIGTANLVANNGDIRGDGGFDVAGDINLTAGQIYPPTAVSFTIAAYDYSAGGANHLGSVSINGSGTRPLPLSAGGTLSVYGSIISQNGTLRAPVGTIRLGGGVTSPTPIDPITNEQFASSQQLTLGANSVTSVSAVDPTTGKALTIPYGINLNGTEWIDPTGTDITAGGVPQKSIFISAGNLMDLVGSSLDVRGGGDLYAYRFVSGTGGTNDILASSNSFAVIPGYPPDYAPYTPYNPNDPTGNLGSDKGYVNTNLTVGDQIFLQGGGGLAAGTYTLLPARYALLSGAFLVTPSSTTPNGTAPQADGSTIVSGYRFNDLNSARVGAPLYSSFDVAPQSVVRARAEYDNFSANSYLKASAISDNVAVPRLPIDSGQLVLAASASLAIQGQVLSQAPSGGFGSLVDISAPGDILIARPGVTGAPGELVIDASSLTAFGADSLLIGGYRQIGSNGTSVTVTTSNLTVDNSESPLTEPDVILVANDTLTLAPNADVESSGAISNAGTLLVTGNGALLRINSDSSAQILRTAANPSQFASLVIGAGAKVTGASLILDSSSATSIDPRATITGISVSIDSGQISLQLASVGNPSGLVLSSATLSSLENGAQSISLLSYSSIDIYGSGDVGALDGSGQPTLVNLALHAGEIRGFDLNGGTVNFNAQNILLDNASAGSSLGATAANDGSLVFNAGIVRLGANQLNIDQFANLTLNATNGVLLQQSGGLSTSGSLMVSAPLITGATGAESTITALGAIDVETIPNATAMVTSGLGAKLTLVGASIAENSSIALSSGYLSMEATSGDLSVGGTLDASGTAQSFFDITKYTSGGAISLTADNGNVNLGVGSMIKVAAQPGGGNAGGLTINAIHGNLIFAGTLSGAGGTGGTNGTFSLDIGSLPTLASLSSQLNSAGFTQSRSFRVRTGDVTVDGTATSQSFDLSADQGSVTVTGTIDASGATGGTIDLAASGSLTLSPGSSLTIAGQNFDDAGKGGAISLAAGSETNGSFDTNAVLDIQSGSTINLSVAANTANSASLGDFTGTLHLRAPQTAGGTDLQMNPINGTVIGASSIIVEGYQIFSATDGSIDNQEANVLASGNLFGGNASAISSRLLANNAGLASIVRVEPGAEIINLNGDLTLASNWDLSTYRFGPNANPAVRGSGNPGILTLRASGNINFNFGASLSDGFDPTGGSNGLWDATLLSPGMRSWSYNIVAGADFASAGVNAVQPEGNLASVRVGLGSPELPVSVTSGTRSSVIPGYYQTIRTGTGDININAGMDVQLLNPIATIYTAGTQAAPIANFDLPNLTYGNTVLGSPQRPLYPAQYSLGGGNVNISAQRDIANYVNNGAGLVADSSLELPTNWLYRRGWIDPTTGQFGATRNGGPIASTSWWIDFSNFFEGVGALGGGNVTLTAGHNVSNIDAVTPTNAQMPKGVPDASQLLELGGGDVAVRAGNNIDGGVYYVERGTGTLAAGNSIVTNPTRAALTQTELETFANVGQTPDPSTWLPTTLFLGKGSFDVSAGGNLLLGPVANPFLLPQGINNSYFLKTYFSTYASSDAVNVSSLTGSVTIKDDSDSATGSLQAWYTNILLSFQNPGSFASQSEPWLRLVESSVDSFSTEFALMPPSLRATAFGGDVDIVGTLVLAPSPSGTVDIAAAGAVNAVQVNGSTSAGTPLWGSAEINLSDADPSRIPGITSPLSFSQSASATSWLLTSDTVLQPIGSLFAESGSTEGTFGVIQTKQALHAPGLLHANDSEPVHIYSRTGDISGLTLFSGKFSDVIAGRDITDVALYIQNDNANDISVVSAARDIIAYDPNSVLRTMAQASGNALIPFTTGISVPASGSPTAGDIQISGPGALEVLAGRNLDLGVGPNNTDGTAVGLTSIGNERNPYLPFDGATIIASAGVGGAQDLGTSVNFSNFIAQFLDPSTSGTQSSRYLQDLGSILGLTNPTNDQAWTAFQQLSTEDQARYALDIFYLVLRDAGRDHNDPASATFGDYTNGYAAIAALFPTTTNYQGDISLTSREIKTVNGGDIDLLAPGGALNVGVNVAGTQAADQGILTQRGGNINIFTNTDVNVGTSRIFTLRGGDEIIWSTIGNIAAGSSSKTVQAAPPTRVLIDPQSADVQTDLAGLATGGGIGVLESVVGVPPADVDLIAPVGTVNAGDAGIRVSGNINIAALIVLNAGNIQVSGSSSGIPTVAAPNISGLANASNTTAASSEAAQQIAQNNSAAPVQEEAPSIISVEVLGYGGGDDQDDDRRKKKRQEQQQNNQGATDRKTLEVGDSRRRDPRTAAL